MATTIQVTNVSYRYIEVRVGFTVSGSHETFISYYSNYNTARYNKIKSYAVAGTGYKNVTFSGLNSNTTYYVYAVGSDNWASAQATTLVEPVIRGITISATSRLAKTSDNKNLSSNYGATGWGGIWKRIDNISIADISGIARIQKSVNKTISGRARIRTIKNATISGISNISRIEGATITGRARIKVITPEKLPENWNYSGVAEPENWEKVDKTATGWIETEKSKDEWSETEKSATSWSDGDNAGAEEWTYPLEDAG